MTTSKRIIDVITSALERLEDKPIAVRVKDKDLGDGVERCNIKLHYKTFILTIAYSSSLAFLTGWVNGEINFTTMNALNYALECLEEEL